MRRVATAVLPRAAVLGSCRTVYTIYGATVQEASVAVNADKPEATHRSFALNHSPDTSLNTLGVSAVALTDPEAYLASAVEDDIRRLLAVDWTVEFDSFWRDRVRSHLMTFDTLYVPDRRPLRRFFLGNAVHNVQVRDAVKKRLNYLESILDVAEATEKHYSTVAKTRFLMQREVFDPLQREKLLARCYEAVDAFTASCPAEFQRKAKTELELHLSNLRHWTCDSPNAKMWFPRRLA